MTDRHLSAQRGKNFIPIFANGKMDDCGRCNNESGEEEPGGNLSHSFIPYFVHRTRLMWIGFLECCFFYMFMVCSEFWPASSPYVAA